MLELHNSHHLLAWFAAIRAAVADDGFPAYAAWFQRSIARPLVIVVKPRAKQPPRTHSQGAVAVSATDDDPSIANSREL